LYDVWFHFFERTCIKPPYFDVVIMRRMMQNHEFY